MEQDLLLVFLFDFKYRSNVSGRSSGCIAGMCEPLHLARRPPSGTLRFLTGSLHRLFASLLGFGAKIRTSYADLRAPCR